MQTSHTITVGVYFLKISVSFCGKLQFHLIVWTPSDRRIHGQKYECSIYVNILYKKTDVYPFALWLPTFAINASFFFINHNVKFQCFIFSKLKQLKLAWTLTRIVDGKHL